MPPLDEPFADTRDMYMVHTMFRREFALLPALVRGVTAGDEKRSQIVADHVAFLSTVMSSHHHSEDENLWPKLLDRSPAEVVPIIQSMQAHHASIERMNAEVTVATEAWRSSVASDSSEALASALDRLARELNTHMSMEEQLVLPIAGKYVTQAEWEEMARGTGRGLPQEKGPLVFGMALYEGAPEVVEKTLSRLPPNVRSTMEELGPRVFASYSELVHGTATPPRSKS